MENLKDECHYRRILPTVYGMVKARVLEELSSCDTYSFTTDCWSGPTEDFIRYLFDSNDIIAIYINLSLTIVGISKLWVKKSFVLAVKKFSGSHTGIRIAEAISEILNDWSIGKNKIHFFLRDGAANVKKAIFQK
jgi:hypothetical protein